MAPEFSLPDLSGNVVSRSDYVGGPLLVMFLCVHCPYVRHIEAGLSQFAADMRPRGLGIVGINSNDADAYPADNKDAMAQQAARANFSFAYLVDASQKVAAAYRAACTPDFFLLDAGHRLVYRGQFDGARPGNDVPVTGEDLRRATLAALAKQPPLGEQSPSLGCNIKWRGQPPSYLHAARNG